MSIKLFITGTDTEVGKTTVSVGLLQLLWQQGYATIGVKPVASGGMWQAERLVNADALALQEAATILLPYTQCNPFVFLPPIAPHIAASREQRALSVAGIVEALQPALTTTADVHVIEGVGGWAVPLNATESMADVAVQLELPVVLVVGMRLGCLNHAILTYQAILQRGLRVAGWVANCIDPAAQEVDAMVATLQTWLRAPLLGVVPYNGDVATHLKQDGVLSFLHRRESVLL